MRSFDIFFSDLKPEVQEQLLEFVGASDPKEMNWDVDIIPLAIFEIAENG